MKSGSSFSGSNSNSNNNGVGFIPEDEDHKNAALKFSAHSIDQNKVGYSHDPEEAESPEKAPAEDIVGIPEIISPIRVITKMRGEVMGTMILHGESGFTSPSVMVTFKYAKPSEAYIPFLQQQINELNYFKQHFTNPRIAELIELATNTHEVNFNKDFYAKLKDEEKPLLSQILYTIRKSQYSTGVINPFTNFEALRDETTLTKKLFGTSKYQILAILEAANLYYGAEVVNKKESDNFSIVKNGQELITATFGEDKCMHYNFGKGVNEKNCNDAATMLIDCIVKDAQRTNSRSLTPRVEDGEGLQMMILIEELIVSHQMVINIPKEVDEKMQTEIEKMCAERSLDADTKAKLTERWNLIKAYAGTMDPHHRGKLNENIDSIINPLTGKPIRQIREGARIGRNMGLRELISTMQTDFKKDNNIYQTVLKAKKVKATATPEKPPEVKPKEESPVALDNNSVSTPSTQSRPSV